MVRVFDEMDLHAYCSDQKCDDCIFTTEECEDGSFDMMTDEKIKHLHDKLTNNGKVDEVEQVEETNEPDIVNHPPHYEHGTFECIDEMLIVFGREAVMNFCLLNIWKYRKRAFFKNGVEDMEKADWYMRKFAELSNLEGDANEIQSNC